MPPRASRNVRKPFPTASISDVARKAGVSIATVSRVVNGVAKKASPETVEKVRSAIAAVGYRPTGAGQALRKGQSRLVAVLAANLANPAMTAVAASIETALRDIGLGMVLCDTHDRADLQDENLLEMRAQAVRATILLGAVDSPHLHATLANETPVLFVNRRCPGRPEAPFVGIDNASAGKAVADFLSSRRGSGRLTLIHGPLISSATADRISAFRDRAAELGRRLSPADVVTAPGLDHLEIGYRAMETLMAGRRLPAGVFCSSDLIAFGAQRRLREAGLKVPSDVLLIGFDDNPLNDWIAPWLSSVRVPYRTFGTAIVDCLKRLWAAPDKADEIAEILEYALIERQP